MGIRQKTPGRDLEYVSVTKKGLDQNDSVYILDLPRR